MMGEVLEGTGGEVRSREVTEVDRAFGRLNEHKSQITDLRQRLERMEDLLLNNNPLAAFEEGGEVFMSLREENLRLVQENHHLREALADVHRNAEAVVLLSKLAMGAER